MSSTNTGNSNINLYNSFIYNSFITIIMFVSGHERGYVVEWGVCGKVCVGLCLFLLYYFQQYPA